MTPDQSRMARALLRWSLTYLAHKARLGAPRSLASSWASLWARADEGMRSALEAAGAGFIDRASLQEVSTRSREPEEGLLPRVFNALSFSALSAGAAPGIVLHRAAEDEPPALLVVCSIRPPPRSAAIVANDCSIDSGPVPWTAMWVVDRSVVARCWRQARCPTNAAATPRPPGPLPS